MFPFWGYDHTSQLRRIEQKLDAIMAHLGVHQTSNSETDIIRELLKSGKKIAAIKFYREQTGAGLREAKDAVEAMERGT